MASTLYYVLDDEATQRSMWQMCEDTDTKVRTYGTERGLFRALDHGRPDVLAVDVVLGEDRSGGLRVMERALSDYHVPSVALFTGYAQALPAWVAGLPNVVVVEKDAADGPPTARVLDTMKQKPLTYLALRFAQHARLLVAELVKKAGTSEIVHARLAEPQEALDADHALQVFARNAMRAYVQSRASDTAHPEDVYQLHSQEPPASYGNIVESPKTGGLWVLLSPVCDMDSDRHQPPIGLLAFRCWRPEEFADHLRECWRPWMEKATDGPARLHALRNETALDDRSRLLKCLFAELTTVAHDRLDKLHKLVSSNMASDGREWCYVLPHPYNDASALIVDFTMPKRLLTSAVNGPWDVFATVEREWSLHMLHKFSRWAGRLGVQDIAVDETNRAIASALMDLAETIRPVGPGPS